MYKKIFLGFIIALFFAAGCKKAKFGDAVILVTGTEQNPVVKFVVENTPSEYPVSATSTYKATKDINVTFELDTAAVGRYNKEHNTTYFVVPDGAIDISGLSTVIKAGTSSSTPVSVKVISTVPLIDGRTYLIPLSIKTIETDDATVLESSRTILLRIARIINFPALSMNNATGGTSGSPGTRGRFNASAL